MFGVPWLSFWVFPLFAGVVWLAMLLALLLDWVCKGEPHYPSFNEHQTIAYISDVGAQGLKPLFIAMSAVVVVILDLSFIFERYLRHTGRLQHNTSRFQKILSVLSILASIAGAAGLILLTIFDTLRHPHLHDAFLVLFIAGYIVSAVFICWEYQRLGIHYRQHHILRVSFWMKLAFIIVELALAIGFGVTGNRGEYNAAAVIEWVIALVFTFYVVSFAVDFIPALRTRQEDTRKGAPDMVETGTAYNPAASAPGGERYYAPAAPSNGYTNGNNGYANGSANGVGYKPPEPVQPSRNF
ncbi:hypothetical protein NA57DRAFT_76326 [Rhizodiscina lignyota]|uniref:CWH43-like N-terminal domain-containing protein n=1 Tax=Rhizodiscina lignyota TaxID=1504668 RepID=A0A9P4IJ36_9PEZI|nr:hypothetical protein NA57DRAFT_76326 [Rhizodiscina lignyota]